MKRVDIQQLQPEAYQAMFGLEKYLTSSTIGKDLQELIRIRVSVINRCQFCIDMHRDSARKLGINAEKIDALSNWQQSDIFNSKEKAALEMSDCLADIRQRRLPDEVYLLVSEYFSQEEVAQLIMLNATMNAWNRIGISMASK